MPDGGDVSPSRVIRRKSAGRPVGERRVGVRPSGPGDELVTLTALPTFIEAEMARMRIEREGIPAVVADGYVTQLAGPLSGGGLIRLQVRRGDLRRAAAALGIEPVATEL